MDTFTARRYSGLAHRGARTTPTELGCCAKCRLRSRPRRTAQLTGPLLVSGTLLSEAGGLTWQPCGTPYGNVVHVFQNYDFGAESPCILNSSSTAVALRRLNVPSLFTRWANRRAPPLRPPSDLSSVAPKLSAYVIAKELQTRGLPITELIEGPTYNSGASYMWSQAYFFGISQSCGVLKTRNPNLSARPSSHLRRQT